MSVAVSRATTSVLFIALVFVPLSLLARNNDPGSAAPTADGATSLPLAPTTANVQPAYLGSFGPDGHFKNADISLKSDTSQHEVPPSIDRNSLETVVDDYPSPSRAVRRATARSVWGNLRDEFITLAYGHPRILVSPTHMVTDSHGRLIVTDPRAAAIHVIDGRSSFRIQGGPQRRFQNPTGVAVDGDNNIYITDQNSTHILVYDAQGHFLRSLGTKYEEDMFQSPSAIAIDAKRSRLYVLEPTMNEVAVIDLQGRLLKRIGGYHGGSPGVRFDGPSEIAVRDDLIAVLDQFGSRVQVFNVDGTQRSTFRTRNVDRIPCRQEVGLGIDSAGNIYLTRQSESGVTVYDQDGRPIGYLKTATPNTNPAGVWVDSADHVYVTDGDAGGIHVFRARSGGAPHLAAGVMLP